MSVVEDIGSKIPLSKDMRIWCADFEVIVNSIRSGLCLSFVPVALDMLSTPTPEVIPSALSISSYSASSPYILSA
jgi:hypothetical protein